MQSPVAAGLAMDGRQQQQPQQQWTMMQPPQPGMQPQHHEEVKTLWVGDLQYWVEESYLHNCFAHTGEVDHFSSQLAYWMMHLLCNMFTVKKKKKKKKQTIPTQRVSMSYLFCAITLQQLYQSTLPKSLFQTNEIGGALLQVQSVKIIRNKQTGYSEGYGFVEFISHASAEKVLQAYNGTIMPNTEQPFRLNWASFGIGERRPEAGPEHSIFVGDLAPDVTDYMLQEIFRTRYPSVKGAKVVTDANTGRSKGYGFVRFGEEMERNRAMNEMNGVYCSSRPMRISAATPKKALGPAQQHYSNGMSLQTGQNQKYELDIKASIPFLEAHSVAIFHISLHPCCIPNFQTLNSLFLAYIWCWISCFCFEDGWDPSISVLFFNSCDSFVVQWKVLLGLMDSSGSDVWVQIGFTSPICSNLCPDQNYWTSFVEMQSLKSVRFRILGNLSFLGFFFQMF